MEAGSKEWLKFRRGKFTASQCYKLMGEKGGITTKTAQSYILEKVAEELSDEEWEDSSYLSSAIQWGNTHEPDACAYYEIAFNVEVEKPESQCPEWCDEVSGSPDGLVYPTDKKVYGVEYKCPYNPVNHLKHMLIRTVTDFKKDATDYYWQVLCYMLIFNLDYYEFVSYDPRYTGSNRMYVLPIYRKQVESDIERLKENLLLAVEEKHKYLQMI